MVIGLLIAKLSLPEARSLKDKRSVLRSAKDIIRNRINVSVAEVDDQDVWQSATLAFVSVAATKDVVEGRLATVADILRSNPRQVLLDYQTEFF